VLTSKQWKMAYGPESVHILKSQGYIVTPISYSETIPCAPSCTDGSVRPLSTQIARGLLPACCSDSVVGVGFGGGEGNRDGGGAEGGGVRAVAAAPHN
jgi:hypothetical protein